MLRTLCSITFYPQAHSMRKIPAATYTEAPPFKGNPEEYEGVLEQWKTESGGDTGQFEFKSEAGSDADKERLPSPPRRPLIVDWIVSTKHEGPDSMANTGDQSGSEPRTEDGVEFKAPQTVKYTHPRNPFSSSPGGRKAAESSPAPFRDASDESPESSRGVSQLPDMSLDESKQSIVHVFFQLEERDLRSYFKRARRQEINAYYKIFKEEKTRIERDDARSARKVHELEKQEGGDRIRVEGDEHELRIRLAEKMVQSERIAQLESEIRIARFSETLAALTKNEDAYRQSLGSDEAHARVHLRSVFEETYPPPEPETDSESALPEEEDDYDIEGEDFPQATPEAWETLKELNEESADPNYVMRWMETVPGTNSPTSKAHMKVLREMYDSHIQRLKQRRTVCNLNGWRVNPDIDGDPLHFRGLRDPSSPRQTVLGKCHADMQEFTRHVLTPRSHKPVEAVSPQSVRVPRFERVIRKEDEEEVLNILRNIDRVKQTSWKRHTHSVRDRPLFPQDAGCEIYRREPGPNMGHKDEMYEVMNQQRHKEALDRLGHDPARYKDMYVPYAQRQAGEDRLEREDQERMERERLEYRRRIKASRRAAAPQQVGISKSYSHNRERSPAAHRAASQL